MCPAGKLVDSFDVRTGALVDNIMGYCIDAN
jgi:hypothetical protein